jgi:Uncharacterized protein conserved in bacteria (DUF2188)
MEVSMSKKNIHVTHRQSGKWAVIGAGDSRASSLHDTQAAASKAARPLAKANRSELVIHGRDNKIIDKDSFGDDPKGIRDRKH